MNTNEIFAKYITGVSKKYKYENTSEMGYRTEFENFLAEVFAEIKIKRIDHDAKAYHGNKPDYVIFKEVPILYIEVKDIGVSLDKIERSEQLARYFGYDNLVLSDYLEFRFYRNGLPYEQPIKIAEFDSKSRTIKPLEENYQQLANTLLDFTTSHKEPIKSGLHLAKVMGGKAQRIRDNIRPILESSTERANKLLKVFNTFKKLLVHDITHETFADMYAQTLVYGLFVARFNDDTPDNFTRQEARDLVPQSNPLLRHFFDHIVGPDFKDDFPNLEIIVSELCEVFSYANIKDLLKEYFDIKNKSNDGYDPIVHFYEDFLKEYDPELRKKMGAFYTPLPVVQFIVRAVDQILENDFGLDGGLSNTSKLEDGITHKVQILDPATGTGTFLTEVLNNIHSRFENQQGRWGAYVQKDLLPRLFGFEIMMAPYTIAHLKLSMVLRQTGFKYFNNNRLGIFLTNSLEDESLQTEMQEGFGFAESISEESKNATRIKHDNPIMVVIGNPPYSVSSQNKGEWITRLTQDYKKNLNERNIQPLSDDYIKFIRFAESFIEKNQVGIVAMITNNSFIDGIIHRQMRKHLLETFDDIYILDLHGNSKKKEKAEDGSKDENVFDIMQGVSINIFVRKNKDKVGLGNVHHSEIYGLRKEKFNLLDTNNVKWSKLQFSEPNYYFVKKDVSLEKEYLNGFNINELFKLKTSGVTTDNDEALVSMDKFVENNHIYSYKPLDNRFINYDLRKLGRARYNIMKHMIARNNIGIILMRSQVNTSNFQTVFITKEIVDKNYYGFQSYLFPLYLYNPDGSKTTNLNSEITSKIEATIGEVSPEEVFDYIYAVLHAPSYREKYKEFLKIDFPRVPYPKDRGTFNKLVMFGTELRELHLMEAKINSNSISFNVEGNDTVEKISFVDGKVFINSEQYFGNVPEIAWNFYIGGYQPAQKWLKDRKGRILTNEDIEHYQKIIVVLTETDRIMKGIDKIY